MKLLTILILLTAFLRVNANQFDEDITIKKENVSLETVIREIEKQCEFRFFFNETLMKQAVPVTIDVKKVSLEKALDACFGPQPRLTYAIVEKTIIVKRKEVKQKLTEDLRLYAGALNIKGRVTDEKNQPILKASVIEKGTTNATMTNSNGEFELRNIDDKAILVVSSIGYVTQEIPVAGRVSIITQLKINVGNLDEAVVVAYNTTTQRTNTTAITVLKGEQIQNSPNRSFDKSLQGLVPGLLVTSGSGQPGAGVSNFVLRGIATGSDGTFGSTIRNPLIVIDGIPVTQDHIQLQISSNTNSISNPLAQINPSDIETITVLKDAAAVALYGSRASNGVILITTKKGKAGKTQFSLRHQTDISTRLKGKQDVLNQQQYLELLYEAYKNTDPITWTDDAILADLRSKFPTKSDGSFYPAADWAKEIFKRRAISLSNEFSMSGGNEKSNFYLNIEYTNQDGIVKSTSFDRKSIRFNFENRPSIWLKVGLNTLLSHSVQKYSDPSEFTYPLGAATLMSPLNAVRNESGDYILNYSWGFSTYAAYGEQYANPVASSEYNANRNTSYRALTKFFAEIGFLKDFKLTSNIGTDFMLSEIKEKTDPRLFDLSSFSLGTGRIQERDLRRGAIITTNSLRYDKVFNNNHALNLLIGQEAQVLTQKTLNVAVQNVQLSYYDQITSPGATVLSFGGINTKETLLSFFGYANYSYKSKYFITGSVRRDGSSRFGDRQRFGTYWSTGVGWLLTNESLLKRASSWLNYLKLRGSIGAAGNAGAISAFTRYDQLFVRSFLNNTAVYPTFSPGNPYIKWEETFTWDAGLEARFWKDRIAIAADVYKRTTSNMVYTTNLPSVTGYISVLDNIGNMQNRGLELSISVDLIRDRNVRWNFAINWSKNENKLIKANVPLTAISGGILANEEGRNFNSFYLPIWLGVDPTNGRPQWKDSTGKANSDFNATKKEFVGKPQPDGFGSFGTTISCRNIELSALFYYQYGFQIFNSAGILLLNDGLSPYLNQEKAALDRWQKPGDIATNPRRTLNNVDGSLESSTRHLHDGNYVRLKTLSLAYTIPNKLLDKIGLSMIKIYVHGNNLALWTKFPGQDPDNANMQGAVQIPYPNQKTVSLGINVNF